MLRGLRKYPKLIGIILFVLTFQFSALTADDQFKPLDLPLAEVFLAPVNANGSISFTVQLAISEQERAFGLMHSPQLLPYNGMLFMFPDLQPRSFWMKNTPISLDILFFNDRGYLVNIVSRAEPQSLALQHSVYAAKYVLEIGGGEAARLNLRLGTQLNLPIKAIENVGSSYKK